jgi:hypothetical protein
MEQDGCSVEPGELNFMRGKLLLHSPVREPVPQVKIESFDLIWKLLSAEDAQAMRACLIPMEEWRKRREELLGEVLKQYQQDVFDLHTELAARKCLSAAEAWFDRASMYIWIAEIRVAGFAFSRGALSAGDYARAAVARVMAKLTERGFETPVPVAI